MRKQFKFKKFIADQQGAEIMEYALVTGLVAVTCIALVAGFGTKVLARWTSVNSSLP